MHSNRAESASVVVRPNSAQIEVTRIGTYAAAAKNCAGQILRDMLGDDVASLDGVEEHVAAGIPNMPERVADAIIVLDLISDAAILHSEPRPNHVVAMVLLRLLLQQTAISKPMNVIENVALPEGTRSTSSRIASPQRQRGNSVLMSAAVFRG